MKVNEVPVDQRNYVEYNHMRQVYLTRIHNELFPKITAFIEVNYGMPIDDTFYRDFKKHLINYAIDVLQLPSNTKESNMDAKIEYNPTLRRIYCKLSFNDNIGREFEFNFHVKL